MEAVNWDAYKFFLDVFQWVLTVVVGIALWIRTGRNQNSKAVEDLDRRVLAVEKTLEHAPTHEDIAKVREEIAGMQSTLDTNTNMVQRMHDYLLNKKD